ncbi:delta-class carbonic anhydrase [Pseudooceanicola algae]|nr:delta-class carbonic anhydrase [Pseudooceanicola algae]
MQVRLTPLIAALALFVPLTAIGDVAGDATEPGPGRDSAPTATARSAAPAQSTAPVPEDGPLCQGFGPQTPRDISLLDGTNGQSFPMAQAPENMSLCNIHTHTNAEHKGPGFSIRSSDPDFGGYQCEGSDQLTQSELEDPAFGHGPFHGVKPGDTIEVHWVYSSCDVQPGPGLGACLSDACANPTLRVESQVFLLVNDPFALNFEAYDYDGDMTNGRPQPHSLPGDTGTPIVFRGSTTGPSYTQSICSPMQVTWSVRPRCARLDISSLHRWTMDGNAFDEDHSHGVRALVTAPELLAPIQ